MRRIRLRRRSQRGKVLALDLELETVGRTVPLLADCLYLKDVADRGPQLTHHERLLVLVDHGAHRAHGFFVSFLLVLLLRGRQESKAGYGLGHHADLVAREGVRGERAGHGPGELNGIGVLIWRAADYLVADVVDVGQLWSGGAAGGRGANLAGAAQNSVE